MHIRPRHHQLPHLQAVQFNRAEDEFLLLRADQAAFARLLDLNLQFLGGMNQRVALRVRTIPARSESTGWSRRADRSPGEILPDTTGRPRHQQGDASGALQADALRNQLAQHDVQNREEKKRHGERNRVHENDRMPSRNVCKQRAQERASVASPSAPSPRLVSVIPTCTPETTRSSLPSNSSTILARARPLHQLPHAR